MFYADGLFEEYSRSYYNSHPFRSMQRSSNTFLFPDSGQVVMRRSGRGRTRGDVNSDVTSSGSAGLDRVSLKVISTRSLSLSICTEHEATQSFARCFISSHLVVGFGYY
jgi:hypothetical protein